MEREISENAFRCWATMAVVDPPVRPILCSEANGCSPQTARQLDAGYFECVLNLMRMSATHKIHERM